MRMTTKLLTLLAAGGASAPGAPTNLTAPPFSTSRIDLTWTDNATNETGYRIYRSTDNVSFSLIDTIAAGSSTYSDTTVTAGVNYWYEPRPYNGGGETRPLAAKGTNTLLLSLTSAWKFEESSDGSGAVTRVDAVTASGNNLTDVNNTPSTTGKLGNGALFVPASGDSFTRASNASLQQGNNSFSLCLWIYLNVLPSGTSHHIVGKINNQATHATYEYSLHINGASNKFAFAIDDGVALTVATDNTTLSTGVWYLVVGWYDAALDLVFIQVNNNAPSQSASQTTGVQSVGNLFRVGWDGNNANTRISAIADELVLARRAWVSDERTALYNSGNGFNSWLDFLV